MPKMLYRHYLCPTRPVAIPSYTLGALVKGFIIKVFLNCLISCFYDYREGMLSTSLKTKAFLPKLKPLPPFSLKRRRLSLKREFVQWSPSLAAILVQASSDAANLA
ncbi:hypothetical protein DEO72_LG11g2183 [Vigna unguiculata]|uniref:Uncharacterized protein n=1 Tax=Vigna unguiculata TaxID=3917 RepID=A0A4D6NR81_VIGUN|nr:hypothetical protein DEO72_LG11g2183 [Vigna unguiculata]